MRTIDEAKKIKELNPDQVTIQREVKYYAVVEGIRYALVHDWELQIIEQQEEQIKSLKERLASTERGERAADQEVERLQKEVKALRGLEYQLCIVDNNEPFTRGYTGVPTMVKTFPETGGEWEVFARRKS